MTSEVKRITDHKESKDILQGLRTSLSGNRSSRQKSKELPPLVGAPSTNNTSNRYAPGTDSVSPSYAHHGVANNGTHTSPARSRRKFKIATDLQTLLNNNNKDGGCPLSLSNVTPPSPPITPRNIAGDCSSPASLKRCISRSISLDGSPLLQRRVDQLVQEPSSGRPATPVGSPRVGRSFSLSSSLNEATSDRRGLLSLARSESLHSGDFREQLHLQATVNIRSQESVHSASDHSEESLVMLQALSGLQVVTEENPEELHTVNVEAILDQETGEISHSRANSATIRETTHFSGRVKRNDEGLGIAEVDGEERIDKEEEDLPEYQKSPLSSERRIAAWLEGLDSQADTRDYSKLSSSSSSSSSSNDTTLPDIGNR